MAKIQIFYLCKINGLEISIRSTDIGRGPGARGKIAQIDSNGFLRRAMPWHWVRSKIALAAG
jgi:hypothetical protein